jgi:hypothetical protein
MDRRKCPHCHFLHLFIPDLFPCVSNTYTRTSAHTTYAPRHLSRYTPRMHTRREGYVTRARVCARARAYACVGSRRSSADRTRIEHIRALAKREHTSTHGGGGGGGRGQAAHMYGMSRSHRSARTAARLIARIVDRGESPGRPPPLIGGTSSCVPGQASDGGRGTTSPSVFPLSYG